MTAEKRAFSFWEDADFQYMYSCVNSAVFTGKEKDSETGYYYFGARYYDSDLSGLFLSVDPMSEKYPNISPYAYCAWNPVKLIDPMGEEIVFSQIPASLQNRLIKSLSAITGLSLYVKDGLLEYNKDFTDCNTGSKKARDDLMTAIDNKDLKTIIGIGSKNASKKESFISPFFSDDGSIKYISCDGFIELSKNYLYNEDDGSSRYGSSNDNSTFGLGMSFMHELVHLYFGFADPSSIENDNTFIEMKVGPPKINLPIEKTYSYKQGQSVVGRLNEYREELGIPLRATYASHPKWGVPFRCTNGSELWIKD